MTDAELNAWLVDCTAHTSADRRLEEAFLALYQRCRQAEEERDLRRLVSLVADYGATAVGEALRR